MLEREMESVIELMGQADVKYYSAGRRNQKKTGKEEKTDRGQRGMLPVGQRPRGQPVEPVEHG